jgi:hypothetical protein
LDDILYTCTQTEAIKLETGLRLCLLSLPVSGSLQESRTPCRILDEKSDIDDIRFLLKHLGIRDFAAAIGIIGKFYNMDMIPVKTKYVLESLIGEVWS